MSSIPSNFSRYSKIQTKHLCSVEKTPSHSNFRGKNRFVHFSAVPELSCVRKGCCPPQKLPTPTICLNSFDGKPSKNKKTISNDFLDHFKKICPFHFSACGPPRSDTPGPKSTCTILPTSCKTSLHVSHKHTQDSFHLNGK